ncbi:hypothetical protein [Streptomyces californicus]|uniref:hypothetical protein n=1 Tax=Streptomyces californicus TaxID=67351 RepID=UPI0037BBDD52
MYDINPVRRAQAQARAQAQGFSVARDRDAALKSAGLVLCATGALPLRGEDFPEVKNGAFVATVTSSEDELELSAPPDGYRKAATAEHITRY